MIYLPLDRLLERQGAAGATNTTMPEVTVTPARPAEDAGGERGRSRGNR
jgi:hypothetical protein